MCGAWLVLVVAAGVEFQIRAGRGKGGEDCCDRLAGEPEVRSFGGVAAHEGEGG